MTARTPNEWAALGLAVVVAGSVVAFGVAVVGSFLDLPPAAIALLSLAGIAAIVYPVVRSRPSDPSDPSAPSSGRTV